MKIKSLLIAVLLLGGLSVNAANVVWVTNANPTGAGSLAGVIADGGTLSGDTVKFNTSTWGDNRTITLTKEITILKNIVIDGEKNNIVISGNNSVGIFSVTSGYVIFISNLILQNGKRSMAGAILFSGSTGSLTLTNVRFINNTSTNYAGAVSASGPLTVNNCYFSGNTASSYAGAIRSTSTLSVTNSIFENNSSTRYGGAIVGYILTVTGSVFKNNTAVQYGGAIAMYNANYEGNSKILANTFIGNSCTDATMGGGAFAANISAGGNALLAANIFQDNTSAAGADYNDFYNSNEAVSVGSAGYNVFKGAAVPSTAADIWTSAATDKAFAGDIVDAETGRIADASPAIRFVTAGASPIEGLAFPETDLFGNPYAPPYNAGADQTKPEVEPQDIIAGQPDDYQNGVEKNIGTSPVDATPLLSLQGIRFILPAGLVFTESSATLKNGGVFSLSDVTVSDGDNGTATLLQLTVNFEPAAEQEYTDTLVISAAGANNFVIPLRGAGISWTVAPVEGRNFGSVAVGNTSEAQTVTITGSSASGAFSYSLKDSQTGIFLITQAEGYSATGGGDLEIRFAPATVGEVYKDTLLIGSEGSERTCEIALEGSALPIATAKALSFGNVVVSDNDTQTLPVTIAAGYNVSVNAYTSSETAFTVATGENWSATGGGDLLVTFTPAAAGDYTATLTLSGDGFDDITVALDGEGLPRPVAGSDPNTLDFGRVVASQTKTETLTVTLSDPQSLLTADGVFTLAQAGAGVFEIGSITQTATAEADVVEVTLSFTPSAVAEYLDTLIVRADYAEEYRIPLSGIGFRPVVTSEPAVLDFGKVVAGQTGTATVTVTLSEFVSVLTESSLSLAGSAEGAFEIALFEGVSAVDPQTDVVEVTLSFTPPAVAEYLDTLIVRAAYAEEYRIPLTGIGFLPVVTSEPVALDFGEVVENQTKKETVTVTLTDPVAPLTADGVFSLAQGGAGVFEIGSKLQISAPAETDAVRITLSFTPPAVAEYLDTLIVRAAYAEEYRIPLSGTGINDDVAIQNVKAETPQVSVRNGNIVVSRITAGNRISVYNLHGQLVKMQTATSAEETLKTTSFPHGVYIVVINEKQEILKRKIVL